MTLTAITSADEFKKRANIIKTQQDILEDQIEEIIQSYKGNKNHNRLG